MLGEWIQSRALLRAEGQEYHFAIVGTGGELLGGCGVNQVDRIHKFGNLGYWVRTAATGRGVATEAVGQLAEFIFRNTDLVRLEILCATGNERSQRVAGRAGAVREGVLRQRLLLHGQPVWTRPCTAWFGMRERLPTNDYLPIGAWPNGVPLAGDPGCWAERNLVAVRWQR